ncbi:hypothetical protein R3P38DRAFT_3355818, partial [Favolaschia claudopus]
MSCRLLGLGLRRLEALTAFAMRMGFGGFKPNQAAVDLDYSRPRGPRPMETFFHCVRVMGTPRQSIAPAPVGHRLLTTNCLYPRRWTLAHVSADAAATISMVISVTERRSRPPPTHSNLAPYMLESSSCTGILAAAARVPADPMLSFVPDLLRRRRWPALLNHVYLRRSSPFRAPPQLSNRRSPPSHHQLPLPAALDTRIRRRRCDETRRYTVISVRSSHRALVPLAAAARVPSDPRLSFVPDLLRRRRWPAVSSLLNHVYIDISISKTSSSTLDLLKAPSFKPVQSPASYHSVKIFAFAVASVAGCWLQSIILVSKASLSPLRTHTTTTLSTIAPCNLTGADFIAGWHLSRRLLHSIPQDLHRRIRRTCHVCRQDLTPGAKSEGFEKAKALKTFAQPLPRLCQTFVVRTASMPVDR